MIRDWVCALLAGCACGGAAAERVEAELKNAGDSVAAVYYAIGGPVPRDGDIKATTMRGGRFSLDVPDSDSVYEVLFFPTEAAERIDPKRPGRGWVPETKVCRFYLFPGERVRVKGVLSDSMLVWNVDTPLYERKHKAERGEYTNYRLREYRAAREAERVFAGGASEDTIRAVFDRSRRWRQAQRGWERAWIEGHPDDELAGLYLLRASAYDDLDSLYGLLGANVRNGRLKPLLDDRMASYREMLATEKARERMRTSADIQAPDFTLPDVQGEPFTLSALFGKGRYVVLDFWGTWCGWCVKGIPRMKTYYSKYESRVEFVGVDCNESEQDWREGLEKYRMPWPGVWAGDDRSVQTAYGVEAFPTKIVIAPSGRILKRFEGESEEFYRYLDSLPDGVR